MTKSHNFSPNNKNRETVAESPTEASRYVTEGTGTVIQVISFLNLLKIYLPRFVFAYGINK